jgi:beta-lactamase superfamily II metal-dependent hydrolase
MPAAAGAQDANAVVEFLYVGLGDATLVRSPEGHVALIDAGPGDEIAAQLRERGVRSIDLVVLTHRHVDHFGAMDAILKSFPVARIIENGSPNRSTAYDRLLQTIAEHGIRMTQPGQAAETIDLGSVRLRVMPLPPAMRDPSVRPARMDASENDRSIGVRIEYGSVSFLVTGDSNPAERAWWLANADPSLYRNTTILKLAHHGAKTGVDDAWLDATTPQTTVVSMGLDVIWRQWEMPAAEVVQLLRKRGLRLHNTALSGSIAVRTNGRSWEIFKDRRIADMSNAWWQGVQYATLACYLAALAGISWRRRARWAPLFGYRVILVLGPIVLVLYHAIGSSFGLSDLFWHDRASIQFLAGMSVAILALLVARLALAVEREGPAALAGNTDTHATAIDVVVALLYLVLPAVFLPVFSSSREWSGGDLLHRLWLPAGMLTVLMLAKGAARMTDIRLTRRAEAVFTPRLVYATLAFIVGTIVTLVLTGLARPPAAVSICLLCATAAVSLYATHRMPLSRMVVFAFGVAWIAFAVGRDPYRLRFSGLDAYYDSGSPVDISYYRGSKDGLRGSVGSQAPAHDEVRLQNDEHVLDRWRHRHPDPSKRPLVVVSVSGGGIAAAVWTALCFDELNRTVPGFASYVRIITGASGGMVAAGHFAASLMRPSATGAPHAGTVLSADLDGDFLTPVASHIALAGLPSLFWPWPLANDRGRVLESAWEQHTRGSLATSFSALSTGEAEGWRPSLIVTPMMVEEGRPLLVSNLDLAYLDELELFRLFPRAAGLRLSTVIRMNAAFPLVTPAATIPTLPPRRVVDAGYYDNYGVMTAAAWIRQHQDWLTANTSGVLLIQIRAYPIASVDNVDRIGEYLHRTLQGTTTPLEGYTAAKKRAMIERNDSLVASLQESFQRSVPNQHFFTTVVLESQEEAALSWSMSRADRRRLTTALESIENALAFERIQILLGAKRPRPGSIARPDVN